MAITTISIALDDRLEREIEQFSREDGVSKSVVMQRLLEQAVWDRAWSRMQALVQAQAHKLGIDALSTDEIEDFLDLP